MTESQRIINTWDQLQVAGGDHIAFTYQPRGDGRMMQVPGWHVFRIKNGVEITTDPDAAWYDRGKKFFSTLSGRPNGLDTPHLRRMATLKMAITWAIKTGLCSAKTKFVRNAMGDFVEEAIQKKYPIQRSR